MHCIMYSIILQKKIMSKNSGLKSRNISYNNKPLIIKLKRSVSTSKKSTILELKTPMHKLSLNLAKVRFLLS